MRKSFIALILLIMLLPGQVFAESSIHLNVDGVATEAGLDQSKIEGGRLLVPLRTVSEILGAEVGWDESARTVSIVKGERTIKLPVNDYFVWINGKEMMLDAPARIENGQTLVSIRFVSEALQFLIQWDADLRTIEVATEQAPQEELSIKPAVFDEESLKWLAKIIYSESNGEPYEGQIAVGSVIMNRASSGKFPSSVKGVIFQKDGDSYQFTPVKTGKIYNVQPDETAWKAAKVALSGVDLSKGALYFYNPVISRSAWFTAKQTTLMIGHHAFAK